MFMEDFICHEQVPFFLMKLELCGKVLALHGGQDLYVYLWIFDLLVWALLRTIARLFVFFVVVVCLST